METSHLKNTTTLSRFYKGINALGYSKLPASCQFLRDQKCYLQRGTNLALENQAPTQFCHKYGAIVAQICSSAAFVFGVARFYVGLYTKLVSTLAQVLALPVLGVLFFIAILNSICNIDLAWCARENLKSIGV